MTSDSNKLWIDALCSAEQLPESYAATVFYYVAPLAERINALHVILRRPIVIGINGAQGSGKTTLTLFLANWLQHELGLSVASLSLDDLYLSKRERQQMAEQQHPLLRTRGVPGTHDVALGKKLLTALTESGRKRVVALPRFDKARDDRLGPSDARRVEAPVNVVLFEGWCVGAYAQPDADLGTPVNALEAKEDADGVWRKFVNEKLKGEYLALFERLDALVMLRVPSFDKVLEWRQLQEQKLRNSTAAGLNPAEVQRFVMHFERLTRHMLETLPAYADSLIDIDDSHRIVAVTNRQWPFEVTLP